MPLIQPETSCTAFEVASIFLTLLSIAAIFSFKTMLFRIKLVLQILIFFNVTKNCVLQLFVDNVDRKREFREHLRGKKKTKYFLIF